MINNNLEVKIFEEVKNYVFIIALERMYSMYENSWIITDHFNKLSEFDLKEELEPDDIFFAEKVYGKVASDMCYTIMRSTVSRLYKYYKMLGKETFKELYSQYLEHIIKYLLDVKRIDDFTMNEIKGSRRGLLIMFNSMDKEVQ